ncbi:MAG TPA: hypothetical protein VM571_04065, partial [Noviherbaspirillum sp.]|nr:hypothetical protein [Noviherbaspirillum sp.]
AAVAAPPAASVSTPAPVPKEQGLAAQPVVNVDAALAPSPAVDATPKEGVLQQRLAVTQAWLDKEGNDRYSIQLILENADNPAQLERLLRKIDTEVGLEQVYVYPTRLGGIARFGIVYGSFAVRAEAVEEMKRISQQWRYQPQLRTIGGLKKEIARSRNDGVAQQAKGGPA